MTLPSFPNQGSTNWYAWAQGVHDAVEDGASDTGVAALVEDTNSATAVALRAAYGAQAVAASGLVARTLGRGVLDFWADQAFLAPPSYDTPTFTDTASNSGATTGTITSATLIREKRVGDVSGANLDTTGDTHFRYSGAPAGVPNSNFPALFVETEYVPGAAAAFLKWAWSIATETNAAAVAFKLRTASSGTSINYRLQVNGRWVTEDSVTVAETGGTTREFKFVFPDARPRRITLHIYDQTAFGGVWVTSGHDAKRPADVPQRRIAVVGDSFTAGAAGVSRGDTYAPRLAHLLGADQLIIAGIGGTRWMPPGGSGDASLSHFAGRMPAVLGMNPDVVIFFGSRNDPTGDLTALAGYVQSTVELAAAVPEVYVSGTATALAQNAAVRTGAQAAGRPFIDLAGLIYGTGKVGTPTGDGNADYYLASDGIHPTLEGHKAIARRFFQGIQGAWSMS